MYLRDRVAEAFSDMLGDGNGGDGGDAPKSWTDYVWLVLIIGLLCWVLCAKRNPEPTPTQRPATQSTQPR